MNEVLRLLDAALEKYEEVKGIDFTDFDEIADELRELISRLEEELS